MHFSNDVQQALAADEPVFGARTKTVSPIMIEVFAEVGFDFVWVDLEHFGPAPSDSHSLAGLARAADAAGTELLVRVPKPDPAVIRKVFDTGVRIVLVSRVETAAAARTAVKAARFTYEGKAGERGSASARSNIWGFADNKYFDREDRTTMVGVMLETKTAVENVDNIIAVPKLDFVFLGPSDLAVTMGHPGDIESRDVQSALEQLRTAALDAEITVGCVASTSDSATQAVDDGFQILRVGDDVDDLATSLHDKLEAIPSFR